MNTSIGGSPTGRSGRRSDLVAAAVALALLSSAAAQAQTIPFQSSARQTYGTGLGQEALPRGGTFRPRVETAVQYVDNINTASKGQDQVNTWGLELAPGIYAAYSSSSVTAAIDYSVIGRAWDDSDYNNISQQGAANGRWIAVPDLFYIDAQGSITDNVISPLLGSNYGGLGALWRRQSHPAGNGRGHADFRQAIRRIQPAGPVLVRPSLVFRRRRQCEPGGLPRAGRLAGPERLQSPFGNKESGRKLTGDVFYNWQKTDYDNALPYNYEELGADLAWQFTPSTALVGQFGIESDLDKSTTAGGLDSNFWDVGLRWQPDERTSRRGALRPPLFR